MNRIYLHDDPTLIEEVTQLGLDYRMVTQYTSFVAVEERREPAEHADADDEDPEAAARTTVSARRARSRATPRSASRRPPTRAR